MMISRHKTLPKYTPSHRLALENIAVKPIGFHDWEELANRISSSFSKNDSSVKSSVWKNL